MAALEKLVKALEALKSIYSSSTTVEESATVLRCKEKASLCKLIADILCSPEARSAHNFPSLLSFSMETLLHMCDDQDSNIRMIADECLNRIIRAMMDSNIMKIHVELHKEIKENGSARSLRAALWRFADLAHMIRPPKGRPYIQSLVPCLINIAKRKEESVLETLSVAIPKIFAALGSFTVDNDIRNLLKVFLQNVKSEHAVARRTAATSIVNICLHCPKTQFFLIYTLNSLIDSVVPIKSDQSPYTILGVLNCIRGLLPYLDCEGKETILRGSFGVKRNHNRQASLSVDTLIQVYELCLYWTGHSDHNIVTASLETLNQLLTTPPAQLSSVLLSPLGLTRSRIHNPILVGKLTTRTLSEMSVASSVPAVDDSSLEVEEPSLTSPSLGRWLPPKTQPVGDQPELLEPPPLSQCPDEGDTESECTDRDSEVIARDLELPLESETNSPRNSPSPPPIDQIVLQNWDIGEVIEANQCSLVYCARRLVTAFLIPDSSSIRVSVRALAIGCLSQLLRLYPQVFSASIDKNGLSTPKGFSHISDVLCFSTHTDQQLRGLIRVLIGYLIRARLKRGWDCTEEDHLILTKDNMGSKNVPLEILINTLLEGLNDQSSVTVRHTLVALSSCLADVLESRYHQLSLPILEKLISLANNPYWLVKVKLAELICNLTYQCIYFVTGDGNYQARVLQSVVLVLLGVQDNRIRKAVAEGITRLVENLYYPVDFGQDDVAITRATSISRKVFSDTIEPVKGTDEKDKLPSLNEMRENTLSRLVQILSQTLLESSSKHLTCGCIEALSLLSEKYPTTLYPRGWQCILENAVHDQASASHGLLAIAISLLTSSPVSLDLDTHQMLLNLSGNLFTGLSFCYSVKGPVQDSGQIWSAFSDKKLGLVVETLLQHVMRLMLIFVRILDDMTYSRNIGSSPLKRRPTRGTSPNKATSTPEKEGNKDEKGRPYGQFAHIPHCLKLYDIVRSAYNNYRISLDSEACEKFLSLIHCVLNCLEQLLCQAGSVETGRIAEEILLYLRVTFILDSTASVRVVNQLLKSLFETNCGQPSPTEIDKDHHRKVCGFYSNVFFLPLQNLANHLDINAKSPFDFNKVSGNTSFSERLKPVTRQYDRDSLAANIKLFEPIVIQALKEYTKTSNVRLQVQVLQLLTQLVQLKVNYCLLDSDQIFIEFVLKQFEYLERGQIHHADLLIPQIFQFLVHLSNEKNHSKPVISVPKIMQLCDGLMASSQNPVTHCIPALRPVIEHLFLSNSTGTSDLKELETFREVILTMLLRLAEYPQVLTMLYKVMKEGWRWEEHWKKWYRQTIDGILPLLAEARLSIDTPTTLHGLLNLNSSFTTPIERLIVLLFTPQQEGQLMVHWLGMVSTMMHSVCTYKEERILLQLEQLNLCVREEGDDPLNVKTVSKSLPPQSLMAKLLLRIIKTCVLKLHFLKHSSIESESFDNLQKLFTNFLLCVLHLSQPGNFEKVAIALQNLLVSCPEMEEISNAFVDIAEQCPLLTLLWAHLLMLMDFGDRTFWSKLIGDKSKRKIISKPVANISLNSEVISCGSTLLYCEYLSRNSSDLESLKWLLDGHVEDLIWNCHEAPVEKLLCSIYNLEPNSSLLLEAVSKCVSIAQPVFTHRLLHTLEYIHSNYTGSVLRLVVTSLLDHRNIALARLAAAFCARTLEYLLTLETEIVLNQINKDQLLALLEILTTNPKQSKRHSGLVSFLNKLGIQCYDISPCELESGRSVNSAHIRSITLNKDWVLSQVKDKCCAGMERSGRKCARLLSELDLNDIDAVFNSENFDIDILQHCFSLGTQMTLEQCLKNSLNYPCENLAPIYICARGVLLKQIKEIVNSVSGLYLESCDINTDNRTGELDKLLKSESLRQQLFPLVPALSNYLASVCSLINDQSQLNNVLVKDSWKDLARFGVFCMDVAYWLLINKSNLGIKDWPGKLHQLLECSTQLFHFDVLTLELTYSHISSICSSIFFILKIITGEEVPLKTFVQLSDDNSKESQQTITTCLQIVSLLSWVEACLNELPDMPIHIYQCIRMLVVSLGRNQKVNWFCRTPVEAWQLPVNIECPPPLPLHLLHDTDILWQIVIRVSLLGWTGRRQFEETWVCLLSVLSPNPDIDISDQEELSLIMQANSIAVDGISWLILSTLAPSAGNRDNMLHVPRHNNNKLYSLSCWKKLEEMNEPLCWKLNRINSNVGIELVRLDKRPNIERGNDYLGYSIGQLSVQYLQTQITPPEERTSGNEEMNKLCAEREKRLTDNGLDIRSCTQFLLDLYSLWALPNSGISLNLQLSMVKSILSLSDMFTERGHYTLMLNTFLDIAKIHPLFDEVLHQYLTIGICKAAAVLNNFEGDIGEKVFKILDYALKCQFAPMRSAGIHGLLYLLQSIQNVENPEQSIDNPPKFGTQEFKQKVIISSVQFVQKHFYSDIQYNLDDNLLLVALVIYLFEYFPEEICPITSQAIMKRLSQHVKAPKNNKMYHAVMQGLERLILVGEKTDLSEQITRLALDRFSQSDPCITLPALQLLIACIYSEGGIKNEPDSPTDSPEKAPWTMEIMEKTSALFDRIKKGYPIEVELVCEILPNILADFFPASDILTKVIGEFLSPNQPHKRNMAAMVFQVFTQACSEKQLPLLQDWVVHSLSNFTSNLPLVMAVWSLCCFFISASANPSLKAIFPHVQSRIRQCDFEDRKILCIAALDFYQQLDDKQKEIFLRSFKDTSSSQKGPFADVIACL